MTPVSVTVVALADWAALELASGSEDFEADHGASCAMGQQSEADLEKAPARRT